MEDLNSALGDIVEHGGPAQAVEAARLLARRGWADDPEGAEAARALIAAYLHDPYLDRGPWGPRSSRQAPPEH